MKICKHFHDYELVPPEIYRDENLISTWYITDWQKRVADYMRDRFGKAYVNDWYWGGNNDSRGTRLPDDPDGGYLSQHKYKHALDMVFEDYTADEVREVMLNNPSEFIGIGITTIESGEYAPTWVHMDGRDWGIPNQDELKIIKP